MSTPNKPVTLKKKVRAPKDLKLQNFELQIHRATILTALRKAELRRELELNPRLDPIVQAIVWGYYIPMSCCSSGEVPTEEEFLALDELQVDAWYEAVVEVNPHWFPQLEESQKKES